MEIIIKNGSLGYGFPVLTISAHSNLVFCTIKHHPDIYNVLMDLLKGGIIHSFEPKEEVVKVTFFTKYVDKIR